MGDKQTHRSTTFTPEAQLFAQPYNREAHGFFFTDYEDYLTKQAACKDGFGNPIEEFEITYLGNNDLTHALFEALQISQATLKAFIEIAIDYDDHEKLQVIIAVGELGFAFDMNKDNPNDLDVDIYRDITMVELAEQFVNEGLFGEIPEAISYYIDFDKIARDMEHDYAATEVAGEQIIYRAI